MIDRLANQILRHASPGLIGRLDDKTPPFILRAMSRSRFQHTVRWAGRNSAFYKRAFAEHGIDPAKGREPADLGDFYTTPDDLAACPRDFLCGPPAIVFESSGTSGRNKQVYYSAEELRDMGRMMAAGFRMMGITPADRVANAFDFSIWIPGMLCHYALMATGNFCLAFGKADPLEVYRRIEEYGFTVVLGEPTWLIRLTELAEKHGSFKLKVLLGAAEEMPKAAVPWMESVWQGARVKMSYGSVEMGSGLGFQPCDFSDGYHLDDIDFWPEVVEENADGYGELVFTTLTRRVMPLIRYRTRDITRLIAEPCQCGMRAPRIARLRGRCDELVVASGGNLYPKMFEDILADVPGLEHDWQVVFKLEGIREIMELNLESRRPDHERIDEELKRQAALKYPDLMKNLALGIFEMRTVIHAPGTVRPGRKIKRLVDRRYAAAGEPEIAAASVSGGGNGAKQ